MPSAPIALPDRPLVVRPPGLRLAGVAVIAALVACGALSAVAPIGDLVTDLRLAGKAVPVPGGAAAGHCSRGFLVSCSLTLTAPRRAAPPQSRKVDYLFFEIGIDRHTFRVLADPAQPSVLTTDLALDRLWNRVIILPVAAVASALSIVAVLLGFGGAIRLQRATVRALSRQVLRCVMLRVDGYALGQWAVVTAGGAGRVWEVANRARPIVMDPERRLILGITAGDGAFVMPLDRDLRWIGLDATERRALREALGPERLGGWLGALDTPAMAAERERWRRLARGFVRAGLVLATATAGAAWWAFAEGGRGAGDHIADLVFALCGAFAVGLLLGAWRIRAKAARHEAILR